MTVEMIARVAPAGAPLGGPAGALDSLTNSGKRGALVVTQSNSSPFGACSAGLFDL